MRSLLQETRTPALGFQVLVPLLRGDADGQLGVRASLRFRYESLGRSSKHRNQGFVNRPAATELLFDENRCAPCRSRVLATLAVVLAFEPEPLSATVPTDAKNEVAVAIRRDGYGHDLNALTRAGASLGP